MRAGGLDALFFSIWVPSEVTGPTAVKRALDQIDAVREAVRTHPHDLMLATTAADVRKAAARSWSIFPAVPLSKSQKRSVAIESTPSRSSRAEVVLGARDQQHPRPIAASASAAYQQMWANAEP
jgi:hypothetical protein